MLRTLSLLILGALALPLAACGGSGGAGGEIGGATGTTVAPTDFVHTVTSANTPFPGITRLEHPHLDGNRDALVIVTPNLNPGGGVAGDRVPEPLAVQYDPAGGRWWIVALGGLRMRPGATFNVSVFDPSEEYLTDPRMPFFLWLRILTGQRLMKAHRSHLDAQRRDVRRQVSVEGGARPGATTYAMADLLVADRTTPTGGAARAELRERVEVALERLGEADREVLSLRHFEALSNEEVAQELGLTKHAASKRYVRALERLRSVLDEAGAT